MKRVMTFDIVCCKLDAQYHIRAGKSFTGNRYLRGAKIHGKFPCDADSLYILTWEEFAEHQKHYAVCPLILIGCPKERRPAAVKSLLTGQGQVAPDTEEVLNSAGWHVSHIYQVLLLNPDDYKGNEVSRNYFCSQFERDFVSCCALQLKEQIVCQYPPGQLEHPALPALRAYDQQNHSSLYDTLRMFVY